MVDRDCVSTDATDSAPCVKAIWRPLDTSEALFATFNAAEAFLTAQVLEINGSLTEDLLVHALAHIEKRHPLLRTRIIADKGSLYWAEVAAPTPRISLVDRISAGGVETLTELELHRPYEAATERLWRCTWAPIDRDRHWIVLGFHHAVADEISSMIIVRDLLATCSALLGIGELPPPLSAGKPLDEVLLPVSSIALLRHRVKRLRSRVLGPNPLLPFEQNAPPEQRRTGVIFGSVAGAIALRSYARSRGATINGVLAAALLESVSQILGTLPVVPITHSVSMRTAAIPRNQIGCFTSNVVTMHPLRPQWSFWHEAHNATEQLRRALNRGEAAAALLAARGKVAASSASMRAAINDHQTAGRVGAICIANRGLASDFSAGSFKVLAWYPATSNHTFGNCLQVSCATVGDTFYFSLMHVLPLLSAMTTRLIADRFSKILAQVADDAACQPCMPAE